MVCLGELAVPVAGRLGGLACRSRPRSRARRPRCAAAPASASSSERFISCTNESTSERSTQSTGRPASIRAATRSSTPGSSSTAVAFISSAMVALYTGSQTGRVGAETIGDSRYSAAASGSGGTRADRKHRRHGGPLRGLASIVAGRRSKWVVLAIWLIAVFAVVPGHRLEALRRDDRRHRVLPAGERRVDGGRPRAGARLPAGPDRHRRSSSTSTPGGLTAADKQKIVADAQAIQAAGNDKIHLVEPPAVPFSRRSSPRSLVSKDGDVATMVYTTPTELRQGGRLGEGGPRHHRQRTPGTCRSTSPATSASAPTPTTSSATSTPSCCSRPSLWSSSCWERSTARSWSRSPR